MLPKHNPTELPAWSKLQVHFDKIRERSIAELFAANDNRVQDFSLEACGIYLDYSKNLSDAETTQLLQDLAEEAGLSEAIQALKSGAHINETEDRAVLHHLLRSSESEFVYQGENVLEDVQAELKKMREISDRIRSGEWKGQTGKRIKHLVNIGIGGSDLGPKMITHALKEFWSDITPHYLSNVDASQWLEINESLDPEETLFVIVSKTFTTDETMTNARTCRSWISENLGEEAVKNHFLAISTNLEAVEEFGISNQNVIGFWNWVGGRYSLWSGVGFSIACTIGFDKFKEMLAGAEEMDRHFCESPFSENLPVTMALLTIWNVNFRGCTSQAILPYDHRLQEFPSFLQQLIMESNGKQVDRNGDEVGYATCPVYFGEVGTNGQHAFYQLLHQGTQSVPADFIAVVKPPHDHLEHHQKLLANCLAQSEALMDGRSHEDPNRNFKGSITSNTLVLESLDPKSLGSLIALYEHQTFVQGLVWNIFSFDQWGVELGKVLAKKILSGDNPTNPSTKSLLSRVSPPNV